MERARGGRRRALHDPTILAMVVGKRKEGDGSLRICKLPLELEALSLSPLPQTDTIA